MRILALDVGDKRIGVAVSDPTGAVAQALEVIPREGWRHTGARIARRVAELEADRVVVGLPLRLDGRAGPEAEKVLAFVSKLRRLLPVPVETIDERLSTVEAERTMIAADVSRAGRKQRRDAVAAALFLQTYLDKPQQRE